MKKRLLLLFLAVLCAIGLVACSGSDINAKGSLAFYVDGAVYKTVEIEKTKTISLPTEPTKDGYDFNGWYLDDGVWEKQITADTIVNDDILKSLKVYAKFTTHTHSLTTHNAQAPTCTEIGWDEYVTCSRCEYTTYEELSVLGHDEVTHNAQTPTCTEIGWDEYVTCSRCEYTTYAELSALGHDEVTHNAQTPTCTEIGWNEYVTCSRCEYTTYAELSALGHDEVTHNAQTPTCTEIGWNEYVTCSRCEYTTYAELLALGHDEVTHNAQTSTCTEIGWNDYVTCSRCEYSTYIELPVHHDEVTHSGQAVTCTVGGWNEYVTCTLCAYTTYQELPPSGHNYENRICTECNDIAYALELEYTQVLLDEVPKYVVTGIGEYTDSVMIIPLIYENCAVIGISVSAFEDCSFLTSVTMPESIMGIAEKAFYGCEQLTEIIIPKDCTYIGDDAFNGCKGLERLSIKGEIKEIGKAAFFGCEKLTEIHVPNSVEVIGEGAFGDCISLTSISLPFVGKTLRTNTDTYQYPLGYIFGTITNNASATVEINQVYYGLSTSSTTNTTYYIPKTLKTVTINSGKILRGAFYGCSNLQTINIPYSINRIEPYAFYKCSSLSSIYISGNVTYMGYYAFYDCENLQSVHFNSMSSIDKWAMIEFSDARSNPLYYAEKFYISSTLITEANITTATYVRAYAFNNYTNLVSVTIGNSVTGIGTSAFENCDSLTSVTIGNGVTSIGYDAFSNCSKLTRVNYTGTIDKWAMIDFRTTSRYYKSNPLYYAKHLYINGVDVTEVILTTATYISDYAFINSKMTSVTIPNSVTRIGSEAFDGCLSLTRVNYTGTINRWAMIDFEDYFSNPLVYTNHLYINGVEVTEVNLTTATYISDYAFSSCSALTSITIGDSVISVGVAAFSYCSALTSITIGDGVTSIGERAFFDCSALTSISVAENNSVYSSIDGVLFNKDKTQLICYPSSKSGVYEIPNSVTSIGDSAFLDCLALTSITIPDSVTSIGDSAFFGCSALINVTIPSSVISIGEGAFYGCSSLLSVIIPDNITSIGESAFSSCSALTSVTIGDSVTSIGRLAFYNCSSLTSITIPDSVTSIGSLAFYNCSALTNVTIGNGVTGVGDSVFYGCPIENATIPALAISHVKKSSLKTVVITSGDSIGYRAFSGCSSLISATIEGNVTSIVDSVFSNCSSLINVTIGGSVSIIGRSAFEGCSALKNITMGENVTSIGMHAFSGCSALTRVDYTGTIDQWAMIDFELDNSNPLEYAKHLYINGVEVTEVNLTTATYISDYAFSNCSALTSVTIGDSVTSIGSCAFYSCTNLTSVTIGDSVTSIGYSAFYNCRSLTSVTIPDSVTSIGYYAFYNCSSLTSVTIGGSVNSVGENAFYNCYKLLEIINKSNLNISLGSENYGYVGYYVKQIITNKADSKIIEQDDYIFYNDNGSYYLIGYKGSDTELTLPDNINGNNYSIYQYAFFNCRSLTNITIPDSVISIGSSAFEGCPIETATIPALAIGGIPKTNLKTVIITSGDSIGADAFYNYSSLTSVTILDGVTSIGWYAFRNCTSLTSITIPDSVTRIEDDAFRNCSSLTSVTFENTNGWSAGTTVIASSDLQNPYTAATYLKSTYTDFPWNRSDI